MADPHLYERIFEYPAPGDAALALRDPADVPQQAGSPEEGAWRLLLGAMRLRRAGDRSAANDWLNHASRGAAKDDVFKAELLGEAGQALYAGDRLQEAYEILNSAIALWRDACDEALAASDRASAAAFATRLAPLFEAAGQRGANGSAPAQVKRWLAERGVVGRAQAVNCFLRLLARAGQTDAGRAILDEELDWIAGHFTTPPGPATATPLVDRRMDGAARRALYLLHLGRGELELADGEFEKSADGFAGAAALYEGTVEDQNDIARLLQAKFNQANSLLRLHRIDEALNLYQLCRHGFNSIGDAQAAQRVDHAIVFAQSLAADDDES